MSTLPRPGEERFRALFADAYRDVLSFAQRRTDPSHAEDVTAEAFFIAWRRLNDAPTDPDDARAWLFGIARNCLLNARRGQARREALAVRVGEDARIPTDEGGPDVDLVARRVDLAAAWRRLTSGEQEVLALTVFDDMTSAGAAKVLGISAPAYRLRLMRARHRLRGHLEPAELFPLAPTVRENAR